VVRQHGAVPATIAIIRGQCCIGLDAEQLEHIARQGQNVRKVSRRRAAAPPRPALPRLTHAGAAQRMGPGPEAQDCSRALLVEAAAPPCAPPTRRPPMRPAGICRTWWACSWTAQPPCRPPCCWQQRQASGSSSQVRPGTLAPLLKHNHPVLCVRAGAQGAAAPQQPGAAASPAACSLRRAAAPTRPAPPRPALLAPPCSPASASPEHRSPTGRMRAQPQRPPSARPARSPGRPPPPPPLTPPSPGHVRAGGIGGVHRGGESSLDVSADLIELGRTPVAVVCAGAKSMLDIPRTLEVLETQVRAGMGGGGGGPGGVAKRWGQARRLGGSAGRGPRRGSCLAAPCAAWCSCLAARGSALQRSPAAKCV
jgi:hypothetical protein